MTPTRRTSVRLLPEALVLAVLAACGVESVDSGAATTTASVTDSAGVEIVHSGTEGSLGELRLREDLRLGVLEGEGPEQFSEVYAVAVTRSGRIAVGDNGSGTVRVFDRDGVFLHAVGGRGQGPGEVSMVNDVLVAGDSVAVVDWQRGGKMALYDADGTFVESVGPMDVDGTDYGVLHRGEDGWLVSVNSPLPRLESGDSVTVVNDVVVTELDSPALDGPPRYGLVAYTLYAAPGGEGGADWGLFRPSRAFGFDGAGRLYVPDPTDYRVDVRGPDGLVRSVRREYEPHPIGPDAVEAFRQLRLDQVDTMQMVHEGDRPARRRAAMERLDRQAAFPLPAVMDPLTAILVSPDGSFWVQVADPGTLAIRERERSIGLFGGTSSLPSRWELFDTSGRLLGGLTLPARFRPEAVSGREVVGVLEDEFGVEYVVRYVAEPAEPR